jgi:hypothetical protein
MVRVQGIGKVKACGDKRPAAQVQACINSGKPHGTQGREAQRGKSCLFQALKEGELRPVGTKEPESAPHLCGLTPGAQVHGKVWRLWEGGTAKVIQVPVLTFQCHYQVGPYVVALECHYCGVCSNELKRPCSKPERLPNAASQCPIQ